jgi:DNA polymerase-3 subunit chi
MTEIDFYAVKPGSRQDRFLLTCRLVERIYTQNRLRILIHCPDPREARDLDRLLWTWREDSFLPHGLLGETDAELTPVLISADGQPQREDQVLINLGRDVPEFFARFERLCEPVDNDPEVRAAGRSRYKYYRDCGYRLRHHEV